MLSRAAAAFGLLLCFPVLLSAALAVWLEDGRPVLFRHARIGRGGRPFLLLKLRSMRNRAAGPSITAGGDPRVTRVGRILRRYKIDELPQLWNVLRGEMTLVGPRPEAPEYVDASDPAWRVVLNERPGITSVAALIYRNEEQMLAAASDPDGYYRRVLLPAKLALNAQYAAARRPWDDLRLLALTVRYGFFPAGFDPARVERSFVRKAA